MEESCFNDFVEARFIMPKIELSYIRLIVRGPVTMNDGSPFKVVLDSGLFDERPINRRLLNLKSIFDLFIPFNKISHIPWIIEDNYSRGEVINISRRFPSCFVYDFIARYCFLDHRGLISRYDDIRVGGIKINREETY